MKQDVMTKFEIYASENFSVIKGKLAHDYGQRMLLGCRKARNTYRSFVRKLLGKPSLGKPRLSIIYILYYDVL